MADGHWLVSGLLTGGVGATLGGIITAVVQTVSRHGESRAAAADLVTRAAGSMVERLDRDNKQLRQAVLLLTDVLDEVLPFIEAPPDAVEKLRAAKRAAELAV